jgi:hypothetical protein
MPITVRIAVHTASIASKILTAWMRSLGSGHFEVAW